jgi:hypothetical protein
VEKAGCGWYVSVISAMAGSVKKKDHSPIFKITTAKGLESWLTWYTTYLASTKV